MTDLAAADFRLRVAGRDTEITAFDDGDSPFALAIVIVYFLLYIPDFELDASADSLVLENPLWHPIERKPYRWVRVRNFLCGTAQAIRATARLAGFNDHDADDIVMEACSRIFDPVAGRLRQFRGESELAAWFLRTALNCARNWLAASCTSVRPVRLQSSCAGTGGLAD